MDAVIVFTCLVLPIFTLNLLSAGRDIILFQTRPRTSVPLVLLAVSAGVMALLRIGMSLDWALALMLPGPIGAFLGHWTASGGPTVLRFRLFGR